VIPGTGFAGLVVSRNPELVRMMNRVLDEFAIEADVCVRPSRAMERVADPDLDLLVLDWEDNGVAAQITRQIRREGRAPRPLIVALVDASAPKHEIRDAGAQLVIEKPITEESASELIKLAYARMVRDYRRYARHSILNVVTAMREGGGPYIPVTVTNISEGGVGFWAMEKLEVGDVLMFPLLLPGTESSIHIRARVLWTKEPCMGGAQFINLSSSDLRVLYQWLWSRCQLQPPPCAI
jgi:CheY-like chemotaxis protein